MKLRYTSDALAELNMVLSGIAEHSPTGAVRVQARIQAAIGLLLQHPHSGQRTSLKPMRRIVARPYPYIIFYEVVPGEIVIVGVRHSAREPSTMPHQS